MSTTPNFPLTVDDALRYSTFCAADGLCYPGVPERGGPAFVHEVVTCAVRGPPPPPPPPLLVLQPPHPACDTVVTTTCNPVLGCSTSLAFDPRASRYRYHNNAYLDSTCGPLGCGPPMAPMHPQYEHDRYRSSVHHAAAHDARVCRDFDECNRNCLYSGICSGVCDGFGSCSTTDETHRRRGGRHGGGGCRTDVEVEDTCDEEIVRSTVVRGKPTHFGRAARRPFRPQRWRPPQPKIRSAIRDCKE
jgi:hypothetical protein